jgi:hypothetical protein
MEGQTFRCRHCKQIRARRVDDQRYCSKPDCQKARKNAWRRDKYDADADYRANQKASTQAWLASKGGSAAYFRSYRCERKQRRGEDRCDDGCAHSSGVAAGRSQAGASEAGAKSDAKTTQEPLISGRYRLVACDRANSDAILVELSVLSAG